MPTVLTLTDAALLFILFVLSPVLLAVLPPMRESDSSPKPPATPIVRARQQTSIRAAQVSFTPGLLPLAGQRRRPAARLS